jgi:putative exosortase-associated protein (TIGR04073 family)
VLMRSKSFTWTLVILLTAAFVGPSMVASAQSYDPDRMITPPTGFEKRLTKLGRGFSNVLFGWAEIPMTFDRKLKQGKPLQYLLGVVPVLGTTRAVMRTATGVFEMVTFPYSDNEVNFEPLLEPEYLF